MTPGETTRGAMGVWQRLRKLGAGLLWTTQASAPAGNEGRCAVGGPLPVHMDQAGVGIAEAVPLPLVLVNQASTRFSLALGHQALGAGPGRAGWAITGQARRGLAPTGELPSGGRLRDIGGRKREMKS